MKFYSGSAPENLCEEMVSLHLYDSKNIDRCLPYAIGSLSISVILLICGATFAREKIFLFSLCAGIFSLISVLIIIVAYKQSRQLANMEDQAQQEQSTKDYLHGFTNCEFVVSYGHVIKGSDKSYAFIFFCLLDFQKFNGTYSYLVGDNKLEEACRAVQNLSKNSDKFSRCFGAHFEGFFSYENETEIFDFMAQLREAVQGVKFVFGISLPVKPHDNLFTHEERAQLALVKAMDEQKPYSISRIAEKDTLHQYILDNAENALKSQELIMFLQPQYDISTGKVCGADALVRWIRQDKTVIFPQEMIGVFEETGFIINVDLEILRQACVKISGWIRSGITPVPISIRISKLHILNSHFVQSLDKTISKYQIPYHLLEFDISQTSISVTVDKLIDLNRQFDGMDAFVSFEDGDHGTSAIQALQTLSANTIRCNGDLFTLAQKNAKTYDMLLKTVEIFRKTNVKIVAEGIETTEQLETAKRLNFRYAQGFYFSSPIIESEFDKIAFKPST